MFRSIVSDPWALGLLISGTLIWIAGFVVIFRSPKFRRKWIWVIVNLVAFTFYGLDSPPGISVALGIPIGSYYVLWFWYFGKTSPVETWLVKNEKKTP
jgi:hypothetical protein